MTGEQTDRRKALQHIDGELKDFQRATVDHVFRRLYTDPDCGSRFLVADEVGLGKTLVAKGVIARAIDHLWDDIERIDIIYICSNRAIADQNLRKLNVFGDQTFSFASRLTMIAKEIRELRGNKVNFVSFTPGTSFDLKSSLGMASERVLLWHALRGLWGRELLDVSAARRIFQGWLSTLGRFDEIAKAAESDLAKLDPDLLAAFGEELAGTDLRDRFEQLIPDFATNKPPDEAVTRRAELVGELRNRLASQCVDALEPDLVILDEFQRFRGLLSDDTEAGHLANALFDFEDNKTLMLSATPYKMFTASGDRDDDHYSDFLHTVDFLLDGDTQRFGQALDRYQQTVLEAGRSNTPTSGAARRELETELRKVMARTERLASTTDRNGMLRETVKQIGGLTADDVNAYVGLERLSNRLDGGSMLEYWKSVPCFLNFTDGYKLGNRLDEALSDPTERKETKRLVAAVEGQVDWQQWRRYQPLDANNPRLRHLTEETTGAGRWQMLWLAPSLPYYKLEGPWQQDDAQAFTKRLIFSAWTAVPKAIASLVSYDAERQMMALRDEPVRNHPDDRKKIKGLLQFPCPDGKPAAMSTFGLMYPSWTLAEIGDPFRLAQGIGNDASLDDVLTEIAGRLEEKLADLPDSPTDGRVDERWYWAAPMLLDRSAGHSAWMGHKRRYLSSWLGTDSVRDDDPVEDSAFAEHVDQAHQLYRNEFELGRKPDDLAEVLALHALGNPATVALRSLLRVFGEEGEEWAWDAACRISWGFRTLFNLPEANSLIRHLHPGDYWRSVLRYSAEGCLGAVMDEYLHCLKEWLFVTRIEDWDDLNKIAEEFVKAVSVKSADYVGKDHSGRSRRSQHRFRSRFALRFGDERSETDSSVIRSGVVRSAFNSPFWPFVLASTSVGQEGLDFHLYCHAVIHWNLPSNPVDLEQREGRVHRYKGHALRRNVAAAHADAAWATTSDPWEAMFDAACRSPEAEGSSDLVPFWIFPGPFAIERIVPSLPLSRETRLLADLKRSIAMYRLVFGQARQDDLVEYLSGVDNPAVLEDLRIDLTPPGVSGNA